MMRKLSLNKYYARTTEIDAQFDRNLLRQLCDPNRIYDAKPIRLAPIKAVRLG